MFPILHLTNSMCVWKLCGKKPTPFACSVVEYKPRGVPLLANVKVQVSHADVELRAFVIIYSLPFLNALTVGISCTRDNFTLHLFVDFNSAILERVFLVV